jgi:hypothetical protein
MIGDRQRDRDLTIVRLAELPAILPRDTDGMPAFLGESRVIDDPRLDRTTALDRRQNQLMHPRQHPLVRPR